MRFTITLIVLLVTYCSFSNLQAQTPPDTVIFTERGSHIYPWFDFNFNAKFDRNNAPYIYAATLQMGLQVFDISDPDNPSIAASYPPTFLNGFEPTGLTPVGNRLYVACGDFQELGGDTVALYVLDCTNPTSLSLLGSWNDPNLVRGTSQVLVDGDHAFITLFDDGFGILDISNLSNITLDTVIVPDATWPGNLQTNPNARGLFLRNDTLYLAHDAGGLRMYDVSDRSNPFEISRYINTPLHNQARAFYNNVVVNDHYAYMAVDYCGLDVADISTPTAPTNVDWHNPWMCNDTNWVLQDGHTNELMMAPGEDVLVVCGGDTEILAYDGSDPGQPHLIGEVANLMDSTVAWGIDVWNGKVCLAQVDNTLLVILGPTPYIGFNGGITIYDYDVLVGQEEPLTPGTLIKSLGPIPFEDALTVELDLPLGGDVDLQLTDLQGRVVHSMTKANQHPGRELIRLELGDLSRGVYLLSVEFQGQREVRKVIH